MLRLLEWYVVPDTCSLRRVETDEESHLSPRGMEVLVYLAENYGKVITAQELLEKFWSKSVSSDHAVHNIIAELRASLGDKANKPRYIKTIPKRGYALIVDPALDLVAPPSGHYGLKLNSWFIETVATVSNYRTALMSLIIGCGIGFAVAQQNRDGVATFTHANSLMVLPFESINVAEENRYWTEQFSDSIASSLSKTPNTQVTKGKGLDSSSVKKFIDRHEASQEAYVLTGSIQQIGEQVRLRVDLLSEGDGIVHFSDQFDVSSEAVFSVQDDIVSHVVTALSIYLDEKQRNAMHDWGTESASAYNAFLKAEFHALQLNDFDLDLAIKNYTLAIEEDHDFLNAYIGLENSAARKAIYSRNDTADELALLVNSALREVIRLQADEDSMLAAQMLALRVEGTNQKLIEEKLRELILSGNAPAFAYSHYAVYLTSARMYDEAQQFLNFAADNKPFVISPDASWNYPSRVETPINLVSIKKHQLLNRPSHIGLISSLVRSAAFVGDFALANKYLERQLQLDKDGPYTMLSQVTISALAGNSIEEGDKLERDMRGNPDYNFSFGVKRFILGDIEAGIALWKDMNAAETRRLFNFIDSVEIFFPPSVSQAPRYLALLDELGIGKIWQRHLMESITEMADVTGVRLNAQSQAAYEVNAFMSRNNLWRHDEIGYPHQRHLLSEITPEDIQSLVEPNHSLR